MKYTPYVISSPDWETTSGGVRVMYGLYGWLLARGQVVYMNQRLIQGDSVAIYPEIEHGNPAMATSIVRYILNEPGEIDAIYGDGSIKKGPTKYNKSDKLIYFSRLYGGDDTNTMFLPILNTKLFKDVGKKRKFTAYFEGKAIKYPNYESKFIHPKDAILIDRTFAQNQGALADFLNECEVIYIYDPVSAMLELARLCGCRVVMVNPKYTKEQFEIYEPGLNGVSWGEDQGVKLDSNAFREHYLSMVKTFENRLDQFIDETQ